VALAGADSTYRIRLSRSRSLHCRSADCLPFTPVSEGVATFMICNPQSRTSSQRAKVAARDLSRHVSREALARLSETRATFTNGAINIYRFLDGRIEEDWGVAGNSFCGVTSGSE